MATQHPDSLDIDVQALMRGLVHELRNPLSAILTASSLLPGAPGLDEETEMLLDVVTKEARRMNRILTEFSTFAKPPKPHLETLDVAHIARELSQGEVRAEQSIVLRDELPPHLWAITDAHLTVQALQNILENAREALPGGGTIRLTGGHRGQHVWLSIGDSGDGLSDQSLASAFQPFYSNKGASTGLGLSIARVAMRAAGGECRIENTPRGAPNGAIVTLELPSGTSSQTEPSGESPSG
jgi:signal transduction histidine kinase